MAFSRNNRAALPGSHQADNTCFVTHIKFDCDCDFYVFDEFCNQHNRAGCCCSKMQYGSYEGKVDKTINERDFCLKCSLERGTPRLDPRFVNAERFREDQSGYIPVQNRSEPARQPLRFVYQTGPVYPSVFRPRPIVQPSPYAGREPTREPAYQPARQPVSESFSEPVSKPESVYEPVREPVREPAYQTICESSSKHVITQEPSVAPPKKRGRKARQPAAAQAPVAEVPFNEPSVAKTTVTKTRARRAPARKTPAGRAAANKGPVRKSPVVTATATNADTRGPRSPTLVIMSPEHGRYEQPPPSKAMFSTQPPSEAMFSTQPQGEQSYQALPKVTPLLAYGKEDGRRDQALPKVTPLLAYGQEERVRNQALPGVAELLAYGQEDGRHGQALPKSTPPMFIFKGREERTRSLFVAPPPKFIFPSNKESEKEYERGYLNAAKRLFKPF